MPRQDELLQEIDREIGNRVLAARLEMGFSREKLAVQIGITHQQLQKYEKGMNRIAAGRIRWIAKALKKPLMYFYEEEVPIVPSQSRRLIQEIVRNFLQIKCSDTQHKVNDLVRVLARKDK